MKAGIFYIFFFFCYSLLIAQEQFIEKPARFITRIPFKQLTGNVILLHASLNNLKDTLNFILDTGSGGISLDSATCDEFKISHSPSGKTINGIAGIREVDFAKNNDLVFPGLTVKGLDFYVNDYEILTSVYGEKIDGIIGYTFLSKYILKINFDSSVIDIYDRGRMRYPHGGYILRPFFTTLPIQPLIIKDARKIDANFYLDTGAGLSFLISKEFNKDSSFIKAKRKPVQVEAQGLGGKKRMLITIIKEIRLGPYLFRNVPTHIMDDEFNVTSYPYIGGLIGNELLHRFNLIINYSKREIHLLPNTHFRDVFDYAYTGMSLYFINGKIVIDDVIANSPAHKAGFKKDDVVFAVNNNFTNDINQYKNLFQSQGERLRVLITRNNIPQIINFKVGKIF